MLNVKCKKCALVLNQSWNLNGIHSCHGFVNIGACNLFWDEYEKSWRAMLGLLHILLNKSYKFIYFRLHKVNKSKSNVRVKAL